jgi:hypothetical protein
MGRKKKYYTDEERCEAQNQWAREYYQRNKELINTKLKDQYHARKKAKM